MTSSRCMLDAQGTPMTALARPGLDGYVLEPPFGSSAMRR